MPDVAGISSHDAFKLVRSQPSSEVSPRLLLRTSEVLPPPSPVERRKRMEDVHTSRGQWDVAVDPVQTASRLLCSPSSPIAHAERDRMNACRDRRASPARFSVSPLGLGQLFNLELRAFVPAVDDEEITFRVVEK